MARRIILSVLVLSGVAACSHNKPVLPPMPASTTVTFAWDRMPNAIDYRFYVCLKKDCQPTVPLIEIIAQPPEGVQPKFVIDLTGSVGSVAVTARYPQESALSNVARFDRR